MAYTVQQVVDHARIPLNDVDKARYSDATLLTYFNDAILLVRKMRTDLFLGRWLTLPSNLALTDTFPIDEMYYPLVADYITGRAEVIEDEYVDNGRAAMLLQNFVMGFKS